MLVSQSYLDAKITICKLFLGLNKVFFKKRGTQLGAGISLPHCLATGNGNLAPVAVTGPKSRGILFEALLMKSFCLLRWLTFAKAFIKMKQLKLREYNVGVHSI